MAEPVDPRKNDMPEDSKWWELLLVETHRNKNIYKDLFYILHGFRAKGTRIKKNSRGEYILRPEYRTDGTAWESEKEYTEDKQRWLEPRADLIKKALKKLKMITG